jgi:uncharacterized protein (TIGR00297 family)
MDPFGIPALGIATVMASALAARALRKRSLTPAGAMTGAMVGFLLLATGLRGMTLFVFYQMGTMATRYGSQVKQRRDATVSHHAVRGPTQVLAVSVLAVVLSLFHALQCGKERAIYFSKHALASQLSLAILAHHATSLGDTLASELGILVPSPPRLVTRLWQTVPPGTNGGISFVGTLWSGVGGALCGLSNVGMDWLSGIQPLQSTRVVIFASICGLLGALIDSLLGATVQVTYYDAQTQLVYHGTGNIGRRSRSNPIPRTAQHVCGRDWLTNEQVNFVSVVLTAAIGGWYIGPLLFP